MQKNEKEGPGLPAVSIATSKLQEGVEDVFNSCFDVSRERQAWRR